MSDESTEQTQSTTGDQTSGESTQQQQQQSQQTQAQQQSQSQQSDNSNRVPQGYVPVSEVVKERQKAKDATTKLTDAEQRVQQYEQREEKRKFLREALKTVGDNFRIEKADDLEEAVEALSFDSAKPETTKAVITKMVEMAKRPVRSGSTTPMFGSVPRDQSKADESDGPPESPTVQLGKRMQAALKITS